MGEAAPAVLDALRDEHRAIEDCLDRLAVANGRSEEVFAEARRLLLAHYDREDRGLLARLRPNFRAYVEKFEEQHAQAREYAREIVMLLERPGRNGAEARDLKRLLRQFQAIAQHNIIEEERDFFPLVARAGMKG